MSPLPSAAALEQALVQRLTKIGTLPLAHAYSAVAQRHDLYEALTFASIVDAARKHGATVTFLQGGQPATEYLFRTHPGHLWHGTFTYARLELPEAGTYEVHLGVYATGDSVVEHECDVLVLPAAHASEVRKHKRDPAIWRRAVAVECKFYSRPSLPLGVGRAVLGLDRDLRWSGMRGGIWWPGVDESRRLTTALVSPAANKSVTALLRTHGVGFADNVAAQSAAAVERLDRLAMAALGRCFWS